ncbi:hypothetical protein J0895_18040 [Phormidium pseudopriestleyi FRX01]|uniref:Glycosyltransferase RgtA/B/C/D-like domain-containing protein n=1 Tax=Phormidium pseudopriestleyi FRX01 TaxID=1759528 RepID=A0ABS3FUY1_9CYAN|nr:hypothetical protein [Phormidium pseudopriestleyi]MBO0350932.1 hypothetical protein [Phormidium pseudopriestleyi FRX01]
MAPAPHTPKSALIFWFSLSLTVAAVYGIGGLQQAFSGNWVVQDDARQHVFWMQRFLDPGLFPNDLIADYFQSVAPAGYALFYRFMAAVGIAPLLLSKLLPPLLGLITTIFCFGVTMELFPVPFAGFIASLLLNQSLWMQDGLISATPKAFVYPLFLPLLYYFLRENVLLTGIFIALLGLFYPQYVLIVVGVLLLQGINWKQGNISIKLTRQNIKFWGINLAIAWLILLIYALKSSEFGPTISASEARQLPEFLTGGRSQFFIDDAWAFWFHGRSGIALSAILTPVFMALGFLLPMLLKFPKVFTLVSSVSSRIRILLDVPIAAFVMFFAAHILLFKLHLPSRYTQHSLRMVMAWSAAIAITILLDALWRWGQSVPKKMTAGIISVVLAIVFLFYPQLAMNNFPWTSYERGEQPELYAFLQQQPSDILIASLSEKANNLPTFAHRSVLAAREYAIPYHWGYYQVFRTRLQRMIQAQYSPNLPDVVAFLQEYEVDWWLIEKGAFTPGYLSYNRWLNPYSVTQEAIANLEAGIQPAIATLMIQCSGFETAEFAVLSADCILNVQD